MSASNQAGFAPKNGSDPASPVQGIRESGQDLKLHGQLFHGFTKREELAARFMTAMLGSVDYIGEDFDQMAGSC